MLALTLSVTKYVSEISYFTLPAAGTVTGVCVCVCVCVYV